MTRKLIADSIETALTGGQCADDALLIHRAAVSYGYDDMATEKLEQYIVATGYLYDDAMTEAAAAGVVLSMAVAPGVGCFSHPYYQRSACPICL